jgi:uncharacterized Rmd1/YagE family protein
MTVTQPTKTRIRVRALLLSDRIDTSNLEHDGVVSTAPLTYKFGAEGLVTLFRYGVAVVMGLSAPEEEQVLRNLRPRLIRPVAQREEESVLIEIVPDKDDQILPGGPITLKTLTPDHLVVIADALSKSVVLARDEREVTAVFELTEPFARQLAERFSSTSAMPCWFNTAFPEAWPSPRSRTSFGIVPTSTGSMRGWKTSMN